MFTICLLYSTSFIILNNASAGNVFSFLLTLDGVTLNSMDKYAELVDENGTTLFALDSLFAVDSAGVFTEALTYSFVPVKDTNNIIVSITLDESYLSSSDRTYPIIIDPTVMISSTETADACVCSYTPSTNYQTASQLRTGFDTDYGIRRSYIKFNIPSSVPRCTVTQASLEVEKLSGVDPTIYACRVTSSWSSSTITWNNKASFSMVDASSTSVIYRTGSTWHKMDVTAIVQSWVNGKYANYGFVLRDETETNSSHWTTIYSSDAPSPHKPELHITYVPYQFTHYYDATVSLARRNQIPDAVNAVNIAFSQQFNLGFSTKDGPLFDSTLTSQDLNLIRIANQLYAYPRDDNEIIVFWTDYAPGNYCIHDGTTHTDYGAPGCTIYNVLALVYEYRPVIHFTDLISPTGSDEHYKISMSLILMHETAHTFGFVENYDDPLHADAGMQCVMETYQTNSPYYLKNFYEAILANECNAFCSSCASTLESLLQG